MHSLGSGRGFLGRGVPKQPTRASEKEAARNVCQAGSVEQTAG